MSAAFDKLRSKLAELFQLDAAAELDFGIYRILNARRVEVEAFLDSLEPQVEAILAEALQTGTSELKAELEKVEAGLRAEHHRSPRERRPPDLQSGFGSHLTPPPLRAPPFSPGITAAAHASTAPWIRRGSQGTIKTNASLPSMAFWTLTSAGPSDKQCAPSSIGSFSLAVQR